MSGKPGSSHAEATGVQVPVFERSATARPAAAVARRTHLAALALLVWGCASVEPASSARTIPAPPRVPFRIWPSQPPPDCPFERSAEIAGVGFTGRHAEYTSADTWYPSWAADGDLYSPWTDGSVNGLGSSSGGSGATTGQARILGDDPLRLEIVDQGVHVSEPAPYAGRYPCGSLIYDGVWYYGTYCLHPGGSVPHDGFTYNWPWLGPFVGFRYSTDRGRTWIETPCTPQRPLFGEHALAGEPVRIGAPHFVDLGRELEHSPDGKAYLVAHGASDGVERRFAFNSWITGDEIRLLRVRPGIERMNAAAQYEFYAGEDGAGEPVWSRDLEQSRPIAAWRDNMGCVTMTYNAPLRKYLLCVTDGNDTVSRFDSYILESDRISGPWKLVSYLEHFGEQAYFVNIPSKFISADGRTLWLCYAANFSQGWNGVRFESRPAGSRYGLCLQEVRLLAPGERIAADPLGAPSNLALSARVAASSVHPDYQVQGAVDGQVDGYPGDIRCEWASQGEQETALLRLSWSQPQEIDRVWLFDRPNDLDQISAGLLVFGDGSTIRTAELPDDAQHGLEITFEPRTVTWLAFVVTATRPGSPNIGLAEIAVFGPGGASAPRALTSRPAAP